jgi:hypothetical protein
MAEIEFMLVIIAIAAVYTGCKVQAIARMIAENQKRDEVARRVRDLEPIKRG